MSCDSLESLENFCQKQYESLLKKSYNLNKSSQSNYKSISINEDEKNLPL